MKKNVDSQVIGAQLIAKADGTPVTTGTTTVYVTGDGGAQATGSVGSGACTHEGHGFWTYTPAQAETNYDHVAFTFENTNAVNATVQVYPSFPQTGDTFALDLPTNAELATALAGADDAVLAQVALVKAKTDNLPSDPADHSVIVAATDAILSAVSVVDGLADAIKLKTDNLPAAPAAVGDIPTANQNADALLDRANGIETGVTLRQAQRLELSALVGKVSGGGTTTEVFRDIGDTKARITATVEENGNRTAVVTDIT